ncbi:peroxide stress protein YaaA [Nitriliruptor alkaliphilus]|uniref:peroxide stress protein YaaA n=1 Tax=Nitriliruptor alkaliphilus TaxID=427918 RepID=UPI0006961F1C|nr:peroxide stress protein YaaA [Nitriliruptor alkaliphilus]
MTDARPLLLLPPSKGKAAGGDGPVYADVVAREHVLGDARREVLDAVTGDLSGLDDVAVARLAGVGVAKAADARSLLAELPRARTLPAHRRYTGIVHGNAGLAELDPTTLEVDVRIVSAFLGLVALDEPVPDYRVEFGATLPSIGGIGPLWRARLAGHLAHLGEGRRVWDLLPAEHRRVWDRGVRAALDVVEVAFVRPDGRPANAARTKVAKGRFAAAVISRPALQPRTVARGVDLGEGWQVSATGSVVTATYHG